jgi:FkbM family methyltransferase
MNGSYVLGKVHTALNCMAHPRLFSKLGRGVIPDTYCRMDTKWMHHFKFDTILDIGANIGRFAATANAVFPKATIYAFEPLPDCYEKTQKVIAKIGSGRAFNVGLGERNEDISINRNTHSPSSSFLSLAKTHVSAFPFAESQEKISVKVMRLDDLAADIPMGNSILVKIDVQGFERAVISGGAATIAKAKVVLIELSYEELYVGQPLFGEVFGLLVGLGFRFAGTLAQMPHPEDGRLLDADCLFVRT